MGTGEIVPQEPEVEEVIVTLPTHREDNANVEDNVADKTMLSSQIKVFDMLIHVRRMKFKLKRCLPA